MSQEVNVLNGLDEATFQANLLATRKIYDAGPKDPGLEAAVDAALRADVARIQHFAAIHPGHDLAKANQHLLTNAATPLAAAVAASTIDTWHAGGSVSLSGVAYWALGVTVMFPPPLAFMLGASGGPDWSVDIFTSAVFGSFVVDPATIESQMTPTNAGSLGTVYKGSCKFQLGHFAYGGGAVRISFYALDGTYWGLLGGVAPGLGGTSLSAEGDMVWSG